jgi:MFS family permease
MGFRSVGTLAFRAMTPELVPSELLGRWQGLLGLFTGLASIMAPIFGGFLWVSLGPEWVFIVMTIIDLFVLLPVFSTVPETLEKNRSDS